MDHLLSSRFIHWRINKNLSVHKSPYATKNWIHHFPVFLFCVNFHWCFSNIFCGTLVLFPQSFMWASLESTKSIRCWNPWKIKVKECISFLLLDWSFNIFNVYFSRILLTTSYNLSEIVRTNRILNNFFCKKSLKL